MWEDCELYDANSWNFLEDGGDHCGKAKSAGNGKTIKRESDDFVSLEVISEEPQEVAELRIRKKKN
jgi:hypothetical protein